EPNQDSYRLPALVSAAQLKQKGWLFVVAHGQAVMVGAESSSQFAARLIEQAYYRDRSTDIAQTLKRALETANATIFNQTGVLFNDLSVSVVCVIICGKELHVAHACDSRAYLFGRQGARRLTADHVLSHEDAANEAETTEPTQPPSPQLLLRSLGSTPEIE